MTAERRSALPFPPAAEALNAREVLALAFGALGAERVTLSSSFGAEDMVLLDMAVGLVARPRVFTLDTGRLPQETLDLVDAATRRYGVEVEMVRPDPVAVERMVAAKGVDLFYNSLENRRECCGVRKVEPLRRALADVDGWITGLRRDQVATRSETPKIALDAANGGIWKVAPLADWTSSQVWAYIREHDVPYNALHDRGYRSIGCEPCTRAVAPGEDERAGRWWWELPDQRECGIHFDPASGRMVRVASHAAVLGPFDGAGERSVRP